jgi:hypothetical protein
MSVYDRKFNSTELRTILNKLHREEFKYSKLTYYFHHNLFTFLKNKVGEGFIREFNFYDIVAIVCAIDIYGKFKNFGRAAEAAAFIREEIENPQIAEGGVAMMGGNASVTILTTREDLHKNIDRELDEEGIAGASPWEGGIVTLRRDGLPKIKPLVIFPFYKIFKAVHMLIEQL